VTTAPDIVADTDKAPTPPPMYHVRCCKPALPKGLCRCGGPPRQKGMFYMSDPEACRVCAELWKNHQWECPKDSGRWP
jgi:hypothetical protein